MTEFNLSARSCYSDVDDATFANTVEEIKQLHLSCGYRMMDGLLHQRGLRVQQSEYVTLCT